MLLNLSLATTGDGSLVNDIDPFVVLRIIPLDDAQETGDIKTETIRLSALRSGWLMKVDDGPYRVEVLLPNGMRLTGVVRQGLPGEGERVVPLNLSDGLSQYGLDRYQSLLGAPPSAPAGEYSLPGGPSRSIASHLTFYTPSDTNSGRVALRFKRRDDVFSAPDGRASRELWTGEVEAVRRPADRKTVERMLFEGPALDEHELVECLLGRWSARFPFAFSESKLGTFIDAVERATMVSVLSSPGFEDWSHNVAADSRVPSALRQSTISVSTEGTSLYAPMATEPYWHTGLGELDALNLDLTFEAAAADVEESWIGQQLTVVVQARDPLLGSVLGFLQTGEVRAARDVLKTASDMLYRKFANPWAAAAGAHVLLGAYSSSEDAEWHGWVENLTDYFPRITDGRIVLAALVLRRARGLQRYGREGVDPAAEAKQLCMRALSYGVPLFSASVRLLLETVNLVAGLESNVSEHEKEKTRRLLGYVRWLAAHVDPYQPFAVWTITHSAL